MKYYAVVLSACISLGGYRWPISIKVLLIMVASYLFLKATAISYSAADETIFFKISHNTWIGLFSFGSTLEVSWIKSLRKKYLPTLLLALGSTKHAPSLYAHRTILEAIYIVVPFRNVNR